MPKMGIKKRVISMTRSDSWTTNFPPIVSAKDDNEYEEFCTNHCPHKEKPCNGDCKEIREWLKTHRGRKRKKWDMQ